MALWYGLIRIAERGLKKLALDGGDEEQPGDIGSLSSPKSLQEPDYIVESSEYHFLAVGYAILSGILASVLQLVGKLMLEMVSETISGSNQMNSPAPYLCMVTCALLGASHVHFLNMGLRRFEQLITIPAFLVAITIVSSFTGMIFFQEFDQFTSLSLPFFIAGMILTCTGILTTAHGQFGQKKPLEYALLNNIPSPAHSVA